MNKGIWGKIASVAVGLLVCALLWYFRSTVVYVLAAAVVALIGRPLMRLFKTIHIGKYKCPRGLAAGITLVIIFSCLCALAFLLAPLVQRIATLFSSSDASGMVSQINASIDLVNEFVVNSFPTLVSPDFKIQNELLSYVTALFGEGGISALFSKLISITADVFIGIFSIVFISFFFLCSEGLLTKAIVYFAPDKYTDQINRTSTSIASLLSRYFVGILLESLGITLVNSLGFIFILKMDVALAVTLAAVTGLFNIVPYAGPFAGHVLALLLSFVTYTSAPVEMTLMAYLLVTFAITMTTQLIDNFFFQPIIYSSSVKSHPLEIFLVILLAGHVGGILGIFLAIPAYTVLRVVAGEFLSRFSFFDKIAKGFNDITKEENEQPAAHKS